MGNSCAGEHAIKQVLHFDPLPQNMYFQKLPTKSIRIGQVQKLRSHNILQPNRYIFILSIRQSDELIKIQCPIITNYADHMSLKFPILANSTHTDARNAPIIDAHDSQSDRQIHHKFVIKGEQANDQQILTVKVYQFNNTYDTVFKNGLYQANLYKVVDKFNNKTSLLRDFFIIDKGKSKSMVFVFGSYLYSLEDVLRYRRQANMPYHEQQIIYLISQILHRYKVLITNNIVHRDIRPGKIYLANSANSHNPYLGNAAFLSYQLLNLQTARKITERQMNFPQNLLLTVRGISANSSPQVMSIVQSNNEIGLYNPWYNDRVQLANTIHMITTLDLQPGNNYTPTFFHNEEVTNLIKRLNDINIPFQNIYASFIQASQKQIKLSSGILDSDFKICRDHLPNLLRQTNAERIQESTTQMLFALHHRQIFNSRLNKMIAKNFTEKNFIHNIAILDRIGRYYQDVGVSNNNYYVEQLSLLMQLAEDQRLRGFPTDHILNQANQLYYTKLSKNLKDNNQNAIFKIQNAYSAFSKNDLMRSQNFINEALVQHGSPESNITVQTQLKLFQAKGIIQTSTHGQDLGSTYFQKGLQISSNRRNFTTQVEMLQFRSDFQYLLAKNIIQKLFKYKRQMGMQQFRSQCGKCQALIYAAKQTKINIPLKNPLPLAKIYELQGDLFALKQDYQKAISLYQRAQRLQMSSDVQISDGQKFRILNKIYKHYQEHSQNYTQQQKIKAQLRMYQNRQSDQKIQRDDRKYFKKIKYLKQKKTLQDKKFDLNSSSNIQNKSSLRNRNQMASIQQRLQQEQLLKESLRSQNNQANNVQPIIENSLRQSIKSMNFSQIIK